MDVNYLFLCSQEAQKSERSEMEDIKERLNRQELRFGALQS